MNDKQFIELLNLYVDREVSSEDALMLEAEVAANPGRRRVYDQYCRMQKACSMLSAGPAGESLDSDHRVFAFPSPTVWRSVPLMATLAAAACVAVVAGMRYRADHVSADYSALAANQGQAGAFKATEKISVSMNQEFSAPLSPVFIARAPSPAVPGLAALDTSSQDSQLSWIGGIHMTPVFPAANSDYISDLRAGPKAGDLQGARANQEPVEMTAFRFQR